MLKTRCTKCKGEVEFDPSKFRSLAQGGTVDCPACGAKLVLEPDARGVFRPVGG